MLCIGIFSALIILVAPLKVTNYCQKDLCPNGGPHIACMAKGDLSSRCPSNPSLVKMTQPRVNQILEVQNKWRNFIAEGRLHGYEPAAHMGTMKWNNELAGFALLTVQKCYLESDMCHNTEIYKLSGQNLAVRSYTDNLDNTTDKQLINSLMQGWWDEHKDCNMTYIYNYPENYHGRSIGNFIKMVIDKNVEVGCAAARYSTGNTTSFLLVCNYGYSYVYGERIYDVGPATSGCSSGINPRYASLCSIREVYTNYCKKELCPYGGPHIACGNNGSWHSKCPSNVRLLHMPQYVSMILEQHNTKRNQIATGNFSVYVAAANMGTMRWSDELARLAVFSVKQCDYKYNVCQNTETYKLSGQNSALLWISNIEQGVTDTELIQYLIEGWWNQNSHANMKFINKYPRHYQGKNIEHFVRMIVDRNDAVGCAASHYSVTNGSYLLFVCNYASSFIYDDEVYAPGPATSGCTTGVNPMYRSLCSVDEVYTDYCRKELCPFGGPHIACGNYGDWDKKCPSNAVLINMEPQIYQILETHNKVRSFIGVFAEEYERASHMAAMRWDDELAKLAVFNVKQCTFKYDACHNTDTYTLSGQNLAYSGSGNSAHIMNDTATIRWLINFWWSEYKNCNMSCINKYTKNNQAYSRHFATMILDRNVAVGCAAARYSVGVFHFFLFACNYASSYVFDEKIYTPGILASDCEHGVSSRYSDLCSTDEVYTDYCEKGLCPHGGRHIACGNKGSWYPQCPSKPKLVNMQPFVSPILLVHKLPVNLISGGNSSGNASAIRMPTIQWNDELARLAVFNVKQCDINYDSCHNTNTFRRTGQNLGYARFIGNQSDVTNIEWIMSTMEGWWDSHGNMISINKYPTDEQKVLMKNVSTALTENIVAVGCAAARFSENTTIHFLLACNYAFT